MDATGSLACYSRDRRQRQRAAHLVAGMPGAGLLLGLPLAEDRRRVVVHYLRIEVRAMLPVGMGEWAVGAGDFVLAEMTLEWGLDRG